MRAAPLPSPAEQRADSAPDLMPSLDLIAVDIDGTLVRNDTLLESLLILLHRNPAALFLLPFWWWRGRAAFKKRVAERATPAFDRLPYRARLLDWLRARRAEGVRLVLATGASPAIAYGVAGHLSMFDDVVASDEGRNLVGLAKWEALISRYPGARIAYAGDNRHDLPIWRAGAAAILAGPAAKRPPEGLTVLAAFPDTTPGLRVWLHALRVHHWVKNFLVLVPVFTAHQVNQLQPLGSAVLAAVALGLCASATYLLNDLLDLESDRLHPRNRFRGLASGLIGISEALRAAVLLLVAGLALAWACIPAAYPWIALYAALSVFYSWIGKRLGWLDAAQLAVLYTLRMQIGGAAASIVLSPWLVGFGLLFFFGVALAKRYTELRLNGRTLGRGYAAEHLDWILALGLAAAAGTVCLLVFYANAPATRMLYNHPLRLLGACPLILFWLLRLWQRARAGRLDFDPVLFALRDGASYAVLVTLGAVAWLAL